MALRVIGAGVGRTATLSLKGALETLLDGSCYHMFEVFSHPGDIGVWQDAACNRVVDWEGMLSAYVATTDFPACLFWRELSEVYPEAIVLLSTRADSEIWWQSASQTIFSITAEMLRPEQADWWTMWQTVAGARFTDRLLDEAAARAAYDSHNAEVRATVPADRLIDWQPGDGWAPICVGLGLPIPESPFPHVNSRAEMQAMLAQNSPPPEAAPGADRPARR
jgi:hypothetical protein